jgi:hypothetical protein
VNIKKLDKANKIYQQIKELDKEIIEIDKHAMLIANGEVKLSLTLNIDDLKKKEKEESKVKFDEDGSIVVNDGVVSLSWSTMFIGLPTNVTEDKNKHTTTFNTQVIENEALQILGVLLYVRQQKREQLLDRLHKMGIAIS